MAPLTNIGRRRSWPPTHAPCHTDAPLTRADDIELIRRGYTAWNEGDLDGLLEVLSEDIEVQPVLGDQVSADTFTGHDGIRHWRESISSH
jgi:ketosteroid isomerase-like protein